MQKFGHPAKFTTLLGGLTLPHLGKVRPDGVVNNYPLERPADVDLNVFSSPPSEVIHFPDFNPAKWHYGNELNVPEWYFKTYISSVVSIKIQNKQHE